MKLVSSFVLFSAVISASLLVALGSDGVLASPQYGLDDHKYQFEGIDAQDGEETIEAPCAKGYIVEEDILCDLDDDSCQDDVEIDILKKRETINNYQHRIDKNIILPRSLSAGHARVTNDAVTQPIFIKRMATAPPISKEMLNAVMSQKKVHHRRETENDSIDSYLVKRKLVDREKTFRLNHPDGIVQKRELRNDDGHIKMIKRMAIGNEMRRVSGEHWTMPHRRSDIGQVGRVEIAKLMASRNENKIT